MQEHNRRRISVIVAFVLADIVLLKPMPLTAAPPQVSPARVKAATTDDGAPELVEGDRLRAEGKLEDALRSYRDAQTKLDSVGCQRRIAELEDELGHAGNAYSEYANLVDRFGTQLTHAKKKRALKRLSELDQITGVVLLEPLLPNAIVRVDGNAIPSSLLARPIRAVRGERRITVDQPSYKSVSLVEDVGPILVRVTLPLDPLPTVFPLRIETNIPAELTLTIDGKRIGPLPQQVELSAGEHELTADGPDAFAPPQKVTVSAAIGQRVTIEAKPKRAHLTIDPVAADAELFVDGQRFGRGLQKVELEPGKHILELRRTHYVTQTLAYDAKASDDFAIRASEYQQSRPTSPATTTKLTQSLPRRVAAQKPAASVKKAPHAKDTSFRGFNGAFTVPVMLGGKSTHSYATNCPAEAYSGVCSTSAPRGGGLALRLGYFYEWFGLELLAGGAIDYSSSQMKLPPISSVTTNIQKLAERNAFLRAGAFLGGGLRLSTPLHGLRITVGASYIYIPRKVVAVPDSFTGTSLNYKAQGFFFDGGIELGSTPGSRFYVGAFLMLERGHELVLNRNLANLGIDPTTVPASLTTMSVYQGNQYFFGPMLGIAFGH